MRVALVTCSELPALEPGGEPPELDPDTELLLPLLAERGVDAEAVAWNDGAEALRGFDHALIRSTWDYGEQPDAFLRWTREAATVTELWNRPGTIAWNIDKRYLRELEQAGVPTVPTLWAEPGADLPAVPWDDVIVKPVVDLGARNLVRVGPGEAAEAVRTRGGPAMVQPFLPALESEGELSIVLVRDEPLHAIRKRPAAGDFRIQPQYGGTAEPVDPPAEALAIARRALAAAPEPCLYARVDLVRGPGGGLCVIELELIEPLLFLRQAGGAAEAFGDAIGQL